MDEYIKNNLRFLRFFGIAIIILAASSSHAWTSAHLFNVTVTADIAPSGPSTVTTQARFIVEGGYFHGFDFVNLPGAQLDEASATAFLDDQREYKVKFKRIRGGKIRALLADDKYVRKGGITFQIVHRVDFIETGALRSYQGRARFDWTPLIWDVGLDNMQVMLRLPESLSPADAQIDAAVAKDYVSTVSEGTVSFIKFRPVKWYPMRVVVDFDKAGIPSLLQENAPINDNIEPIAASAATKSSSFFSSPPVSAAGIATFVALCLLAAAAPILKARHIFRLFFCLGLEAEPLILKRTSLGVRITLGVLAVCFGAAVQLAGFLAAGIPFFITAAALFLFQTKSIAYPTRPGGAWRRMNNTDFLHFNEISKSYTKLRNCPIDITSIKGAVLFCIAVAGIFGAAFATDLKGTDLAFATVIDSLIMIIPAWFAGIRAELPMDETLEGFALLRKWRKSLSKLLGRKGNTDDAAFFVREDNNGPVEVRLRAGFPADGLRGIEAAAERVTVGSIHRVRTVFVLRTAPGAPITRKLAACSHAAEHHLTPDLQEEIIVLRNRRGKKASGLSPLRAALHLIGG